jgi:CRISPR type IV-associated protein Csf3
MIPIHVVAEIGSGTFTRRGAIALDSLLIHQTCLRQGRLSVDASTCSGDIEIPIAREPGGRFYLASVSHGKPVARELQYTNRRPAIAEMQALCDPKATRVINISLGANKGYRIPRSITYYERDELEWWAIGDPDGVRDLLATITHLGARRGVGLGRVMRWRVEECEPWGDGFPVVLDGKPTRNLPLDWPGVAGSRVGFGVLSPPYWDQTREERCFTPTTQ